MCDSTFRETFVSCSMYLNKDDFLFVDLGDRCGCCCHNRCSSHLVLVVSRRGTLRVGCQHQLVRHDDVIFWNCRTPWCFSFDQDFRQCRQQTAWRRMRKELKVIMARLTHVASKISWCDLAWLLTSGRRRLIQHFCNVFKAAMILACVLFFQVFRCCYSHKQASFARCIFPLLLHTTLCWLRTQSLCR